MFIVSTSTRNIVYCATTLLLTGFITGCSGSMTGTIGSTKQVEITTPTSVLNLTEGESAKLEINLPETSDKNVILRWMLTNSEQGVMQKWLPQKINSILFSSVTSNFSEVGGSLTVPAGSSNIHVPIQSVNDGVFSSAMHFDLTVLGDDITKSLVVPVVLADSDGLPELGVYDAYAVKGQKARVTMNLSYQSKIALPVTITANNVSAVAGVDFEMTTSSITIPPDTLEYSFEIETKLAGDTTEKSFDLTFTVVDPTKGAQEKIDVTQKVFGSAVTNAVTGAVTKTLTGAPKRRIETTIRVILYDSSNQTKIEVNDSTATESDTIATVNIQLSQNATAPVAFDVKLENVTAKAGIDFSPLPQTRYTIPQGEKQIQMSVPLINDQTRNTNVRVFNLALSNLTGATYLRPKGIVTILPRDTVVEATLTPTPMATSIPQPTPTNTPIFTPTPTNSPIPTPTLPPLYVNFTNPTSVGYITRSNESLFTVRGNCSESGGQVSFGGVNGNVTGLTAPCTAGSFLKEFTDPSGNFSSLADGTFTLTADHSSTTGTQAPQAVLTLVKDTATPSVGITSPSVSTTYLSSSGSVTFSGSCSENNKTVSLTSTANRATGNTCTNNAWIASLDFAGLTDRTITVTANHQDAAGNSAIPSTKFVVINSTIPSVSFVTPVAFPFHFYMNSGPVANLNPANFLVDGYCSEGGLPVVLTATGLSGSTQANCGSGFSTHLNFSAVPDGAITITANFTNAAGTAADPAIIIGTKDTGVPTAPGPITLPALSASLTQTPNITWGGSTDLGSAPAGISTYELAIGTGQAGNTDILNWTAIGNVLTVQKTGLTLADNTTYYPSIRAVDVAGNTSLATNGSAAWMTQMTSPTPTPIVTPTATPTNTPAATPTSTPTATPTPTPTPAGPVACPTGYVAVAAISPYTASAFCVAQFEAKQVGSTGVSQAESTPWGSISRDGARSACEANGDGYSLITNAEWQTVARTIEAQPSNWSGGTVGSGAINRGWSNNSSIAPSTGSDCLYNASGDTCGSSGTFTYKRTHDLPYGTIWDLAGNMWEWVSDNNTVNFGSTSSMSQVTTSSHTISATMGPVTGRAKVLFGPAGDYTSLNSGEYGGLGDGYLDSNAGAVARGGSGPFGAAAGIFFVYLLNSSDTTYNDGGFRCAYHPPPVTCPTDYVAVTSMSPYTDLPFCVARYEAKNNGSNVAVSQAAGTPWVNITRDSARIRCAANGSDYALITNAEWQTVARTIEALPVNWSGRSVGNGAINRGWSNGSNSAVAPSTDSSCLYNTGANTCGSIGTFTFKRTHDLPNGTIWDLAGNVREWVNDDNTVNFGGQTYLSQVTTSSHTASATMGPVTGTAKVLFGPAGYYTALNSGEYGGLGYGYLNFNDGAILRSGYWVNGTMAGVFSVILNYDSSGMSASSTGFRCAHHPPPTCPTGYVEIAPMSPYTTSRFCVAQYEAKQSGSKGVSQAAGTPWVNITRDAARDACAANVGGNYGLITNAEWQTVARTIEAMPSNWSGGSVGSGAINRGWTEGANSGVAPSTSSSCLYNNGASTCGSSGTFTYKRTHDLPNGTIWDLAGNVWEWVNDDNSTNFGANYYMSQVTTGSNPTSATVGSVTGVAKVLFGPAGDYTALNSGEYGGLGRGTLSPNGSAVVRGGHYAGTTYAGVFYVYLNITPAATNVGFRCVYRP